MLNKYPSVKGMNIYKDLGAEKGRRLRKGEHAAGEEWQGIVRSKHLSFVHSRCSLEPDAQEWGKSPGHLCSHSWER